MNDREVIQTLAKAGWETMKRRGKGSHTVMRHPDKPGKVTIPKGEIKIGTLKSIERATGVKLGGRG
ncbi:MAG: type II toxin-antitoxin system HicA family toxin [Pseudodesulfovibrio sp.]|uniref:YcfA family protein n=1 Tax=Pseudodesulfovibrio aespoeensis (strain ATCC 700646 / DSM 10631 / Aspo-2) TaxID=643562 RepID=E6VXK2_PSEA9|nr:MULTISPECIES: type II toxin-antitoxin system HicA family toxin [Pseudodesulfovibrio]MBU4475240.1 type II toxin-antitoxin system HicA family toxin [Pseudomonadota bacterium]ADU61460.1 YcfA family protein [Pseudodesulfovibrio aespoeensis Aspo-2]MBU4516279.1 type II toxin-antitoxin system HicA family toxin [Pseudomonadota bacterium]MBU4522458.1 type II toxin-antitoxin system HicA family toxin [Pseudomonadota bacterium]MBU4558660.1 type II toxin-antitoxin system HicA family toxin [Pseudomonadot